MSYIDLHDDLRAVARVMLAPTSPLVSRGETIVPEWKQLADAGWLGLEVPEHLGGSGVTFAEVAVVLEELGRVAAASPYLGVVLGVGALIAAERTPAADELLSNMCTGDSLVACATGFDIESGRLVGRAQFVPDAQAADRILCITRDRLVDVDAADLRITPTPVLDPTRSLAEVVADGVAIDEARCSPLIDPFDLEDRGALAVAVDSVGLTAAALDATTDYAKTRYQFGRAIGSFQAVKHQCADIAVELAVARRLVADAITTPTAVAVSMSKSHATETGAQAVGTALQLHGAIGYTWEHGLHVLLKRALLNRALFGAPAAHRARLSTRYTVGAST